MLAWLILSPPARAEEPPVAGEETIDVHATARVVAARERLTAAAERFLNAVIQTSDAPFTDEELVRLNAGRRGERALSLRR